MRIAILNSTSQPLGGLGTYLALVIAALRQRDHDIGLWHEAGGPPTGHPFALPAGSPAWSVEALGRKGALDALHDWRPDVLFAHGLLDPKVESDALQIAPAVFLAHTYYGTCISGAKTFKSPATVPCSRTFGWPCLLNYYPRRCGGWNPVTMVRLFGQQSERLEELLPRYKAIVTLSSHMQQEYARHGLDATWIKAPCAAIAPPQAPRLIHDEWRLLFAGRMDHLKGGRWLLQALPRVRARLARSLHVTFAGDGPARAEWEAAATRLASREPGIHVDFPGWVEGDRLDGLLAHADLLVLPSLWPEPFGLIGLEAGRHRLPVAAFAVGGIPDWLRSGVNGSLAPGDPPTVAGLASAIVACLEDPAEYARLRDGAARVAAEFDTGHHVDALLRVLQDAAAR